MAALLLSQNAAVFPTGRFLYPENPAPGLWLGRTYVFPFCSLSVFCFPFPLFRFFRCSFSFLFFFFAFRPFPLSSLIFFLFLFSASLFPLSVLPFSTLFFPPSFCSLFVFFSPFSPVFLHFVLSALIKLLCYCSKDGLPTVLNTSRGVFYGHTYDGWHTWWGILKCHVVFALKYWEKALKYWEKALKYWEKALKY